MNLSKRADAERFLTRPPADTRACLIYGRDRSGVRERADRLAAKVTAHPDDPFDTVTLTDAELTSDPARLADELTALSLMGGRRLVRVRLGDKAGADRATAEQLKRHIEGALNPDSFLLIEGGALGRDSGTRKLAETGGATVVAIPVYDDEAGDVAGMIKSALANEGVRLTPDALDWIVSRLPKERGVARQEIERLLLFIGPNARAPISREALVDFVGVESDASLSDAAVDAFGGRLAEALAGLRRAFAEGEGGPAAVRAAGQHLQRLQRIGVSTRSGMPAAAALKSAGVFWKQEAEMSRQLRAWTSSALEDVQADILAGDVACKSTGGPDQLVSERLFLSIAGRARRLGL